MGRGKRSLLLLSSFVVVAVVGRAAVGLAVGLGYCDDDDHQLCGGLEAALALVTTQLRSAK